MKLKDCPVGTIVRLYCIGTMAWDNELAEVKSHSGGWTKLKYPTWSSNISTFVDDAECVVEGFAK